MCVYVHKTYIVSLSFIALFITWHNHRYHGNYFRLNSPIPLMQLHFSDCTGNLARNILNLTLLLNSQSQSFSSSCLTIFLSGSHKYAELLTHNDPLNLRKLSTQTTFNIYCGPFPLFVSFVFLPACPNSVDIRCKVAWYIVGLINSDMRWVLNATNLRKFIICQYACRGEKNNSY